MSKREWSASEQIQTHGDEASKKRNCEPVDDDDDKSKSSARREVPCASLPMAEDDDDRKLPAKRAVSWEIEEEEEEEEEEKEVIDRGSLVGHQNDGHDRDSLVTYASRPTMAFIPSPYRPLSPLSSPSSFDDIEGGVPFSSPSDIIYYLDKEHSDEGLGVFRLFQPEMKTENLELIARTVKDVLDADARIVTPTDLEEVSTVIDIICFCLTSFASNHSLSS
jgi:hypothetical protein